MSQVGGPAVAALCTLHSLPRLTLPPPPVNPVGGLNPHNDHDNDDDGVGCVDHYDDDVIAVMMIMWWSLKAPPFHQFPSTHILTPPHIFAFLEDLVCKGAYSSFSCLPPFVLAFNHLKWHTLPPPLLQPSSVFTFPAHVLVIFMSSARNIFCW